MTTAELEQERPIEQVSEEFDVDILDLFGDQDEREEKSAAEPEKWKRALPLTILRDQTFRQKFIKNDTIRQSVDSLSQAEKGNAYLLDRLITYAENRQLGTVAEDAQAKLGAGNFGRLCSDTFKGIESAIDDAQRKTLVDELSAYMQESLVESAERRFETNRPVHARRYDEQLGRRNVIRKAGLFVTLVGIAALAAGLFFGVGTMIGTNYEGDLNTHQEQVIKKYEQRYNAPFEQIRGVVQKK